ncbi:MAG: ABC-type Fe3+/spermidine/putrescine transport system ATPase subunit [Marivirga sp.]|jgi:ABC-type Fe3+/spermidine/putrescine transport system ATPase subunit
MDQHILLEAKGIYKSYGQQQIVSKLNLQVLEGEILAIVGESGAGKSSVLRMLAGIESYDQGLVVYDGVALPKAEDSLVPGNEEIQYVAQDFRLLKNRSVLENLKEALLAFKDTFSSQKIAFLLTTLRLSHLQEKRIELLSGGEKQRLAIARAMASEPAMLLLDEPFTQLDQTNKQLLIEALTAINQSLKTTILLVTHQADEVFQLADRVGVLHNQHLVQLAAPQQVYNKPVNYEVAQLFGAVNLLEDKLLGSFGFATHASLQFGIRPQHITLTSNKKAKGIKARIVKNTFMGTFSLLQVDTDEQSGLLIYTNEGNALVGNELLINLKSDDLIKWESI